MSAFSQLAAKAQVLSNHQVKINHFSSPLVKKKTKKQTAWHISAFFIINLWPNPLPTMNIHNASTGDIPLIFTQCATFKMPYADVTAQGYKWETLSVSTVWVQCEYREWSVCWHYGAVMRCILHWKWEKWGRFWGCIAHLNFMTVMDPSQMLYI